MKRTIILNKNIKKNNQKRHLKFEELPQQLGFSAGVAVSDDANENVYAELLDFVRYYLVRRVAPLKLLAYHLCVEFVGNLSKL